MTATQLRHGSTAIDLHERLTIVAGLGADEANDLLLAIRRGEATWTFSEEQADVDYRPPATFELVAAEGLDTGGDASADLQSAVDSAEAALGDARAAVESAEAAYTAAQDQLLVLRRDADRDAPAALGEAERRLEEAQRGAADARRALAGAREDEAGRGADLSAQKELRDRRERLQASRDERAARLLRMPPAIDVTPIETALSGLRRLRTVKPRPMARAVEIADRLREIADALDQITVESPPEWLVLPALDALRSAKAELDALESGKPTVAVDPTKVRAVEACHERVLEAEAKVMEKGSRANRRRRDEATAAEREALHALGLSSYDQFLKYLAPTLDAGAREERLAEARAAVGDAETVWAELHGGTVPDGWTELHIERVTLLEEAHELLGRDVEGDALDDALRNHLEAVVDTTWAEDALAKSLADTNTPLGAGGIEAAAERVIAEAPAAQEERARAEAELQEIDDELASVEQELASLSPASVLAGDADQDADAESLSVAHLEGAVAAADAALSAAEEAVAAAQQRVQRAEESADHEEEAATRAERARDDVAAARAVLAQAEDALAAARAAAADAAAAAAQAASTSAAMVAGARMETRLALLARAVAHRAAAQPLVLAGPVAALGEAGEAMAVLRDVAAAVQVIVIDADGALVAAAGSLGGDGRLVTL